MIAAYENLVCLVPGIGVVGAADVDDYGPIGGAPLSIIGAMSISNSHPGLYGTSLRMDGGRIQLPAIVSPRAGAFAVACRIRPDNAGDTRIMSAMSGASGLAYEWSISANTSYASFYHGVRGTSQSVLRLFWPTALPAAAWSAIVVGRTESGSWYASANGNAATTYQYAPLRGSLSYGPVTALPFTNAVDLGATRIPISIGSYFGGGAAYLEDVALWIGAAPEVTPTTAAVTAISNDAAGPVTDADGQLAERIVLVVPRCYSSRAFPGRSGADGRYSILAPAIECAAVFLDDAAGTAYDDILVRVAA